MEAPTIHRIILASGDNDARRKRVESEITSSINNQNIVVGTLVHIKIRAMLNPEIKGKVTRIRRADGIATEVWVDGHRIRTRNMYWIARQ